MPELGHHDQNALLGLVVDVELHLKAFRDGAELLFERLQIVIRGSRESRAQVQGLAEAVVELLVLLDVESALKQERGYCLDDAGTFDTRQCEHELAGFGFFRGFCLRSRPGFCGGLHNGHVASFRYMADHLIDISGLVVSVYWCADGVNSMLAHRRGGAVAFEALAVSEAVGSRSLADVAYERIRDSLLTLEIRPGDPLYDEGIAKELGIGRTPVREALKRLEVDRLVVTYPRRGTFATRVEVTDLAFISEIRAQLEPLAAARAARVATAAARERLRLIVERGGVLRRGQRICGGDAAAGRQGAPGNLCRSSEPASGRRSNPLRQPRDAHLVHGAGSPAEPFPACARARRPA